MARPGNNFFKCPSCDALYEVIRAEAGPETRDGEIGCRICGAPLAPRDSGIRPEIFSVAQSHPPMGERKSVVPFLGLICINAPVPKRGGSRPPSPSCRSCCGRMTTESFPDEPRTQYRGGPVWWRRLRPRISKFAADRLLSGDGSHLCPQVTHDFRHPTSGCYLNTAEIPSRFHIAAFRQLQCTRAMFGGERCNYFSNSWNGGDCHLQKVFLCGTQRHHHHSKRSAVAGLALARLKS
jgi:hypothetical protein